MSAIDLMGELEAQSLYPRWEDRRTEAVAEEGHLLRGVSEVLSAIAGWSHTPRRIRIR